MNKGIFKKSLIISFLGHLAAFGVFTFSFSGKLPYLGPSSNYFWGAVPFEIDPRLVNNYINKKNIPLSFNSEILPRNNISEQSSFINKQYLKPYVHLVSSGDKLSVPFLQKESTFIQQREKQPIVFYPELPQHFLLFFKDRQAVHIELMFNILLGTKINSIDIKRKISSGNLEADLLTMRYISRYLFIEQSRFPKNSWQAIKIDLSTKND